MATIECTYGPVSEEVGGIMYEFKPDEFGRYVAEVWIDKHIKVFVAVADHYRLVNKDDTGPWVPPGSAPATLVGVIPDTAELGSEDFTLHCHGTGFTEASVIYFADQPEPIVFVSANEVTTVVKPSLGWGAVTVKVRVDASEAVDFTFTEAPPVADLEQLGGDDEDDIPLTDITGIGPALAQRLQEAGIADTRALAKLHKKEMATLDEELGLGGRSARDDWLGQAKKLAR